MFTLLHFFVGGQEFVTNAVNIDSIVKLTKEVVLTKLPEYNDSSTLGIYKYQDKIYQVNDAATLLNCQTNNSKKEYILLFNQQGVLVDSVSKVSSISEDDLLKSPITSQYVKSVYIQNNTSFFLLIFEVLNINIFNFKTITLTLYPTTV